MPFDSKCFDCWNHGPSDGLSGECRAGPPTEPTTVHRVMAYIRTADDLPACGLYLKATGQKDIEYKKGT